MVVSVFFLSVTGGGECLFGWEVGREMVDANVW